MIREMQIRNYSPRTIQSYVSSLVKLAQFYNSSPENITPAQFKDFLHHRITTDKISNSMINQSISAFKILQQDLFGRDWEQIKVKRPRREMRLPVVLSKQEVQSILRATQNIKHKALLALAYSTGLRRDEVRHLKPSDIDSQRMTIHVRQGKGKKARYVILSPKLLDLLRLYYKIQRPVNFLFESSQNKGHMLAPGTLTQILKNGAKKAKLKKNASFHTLRHCFATHMLEQGINLRLIQSFMGHTSLRTTSVYLHIAKIDPNSVSSPLDDIEL